MTQQVSGTRNGQPWPAPGDEVDLSDAEARAVLRDNTAVELDAKSETVLVPTTGIHTPGTVAFQEPGVVNLVATPADAVSDPEGTKAALATVAAGGTDHTVPAGSGVQHPSGAAMSQEAVDKSMTDAEQTAADVTGAPAKSAKPAKKN